MKGRQYQIFAILCFSLILNINVLAEEIEKQISCIQCTSKNESCEKKLENISETSIVKCEKCAVYLVDDEIQKGCFKENMTKIMYECESNKCNNIEMQCYSCDSTKDENCRNDLSKIKSVNCTKYKCYSCTNRDGNVFRVCGSQKSGECNKDVPKKRNIPKKLFCYNCNSAENKNCAQWSKPDEIPKIECLSNESKCGISVEGVHTIRSCASEEEGIELITCSEGQKNCKICNSDSCNGGVFPENRLKCHQCADADECNTEQDTKNILPCQNYKDSDSCFAYANDKLKMIRGCQSDKEFEPCLKEDNKKCKTCEQDACNSFPLQSKPTLSCIKCDEKNQSCAWGHDESKKDNCTREFYYYSKESCYIKTVDDKQVHRGCSLDDGIIPDDSSNIIFCTSPPGCNKDNVITQSCIQCDSNNPNQSKCVNGKDIQVTKCSGVVPYENRGCYTKHEGERVIRGCVADLENLKNCKNEKDANANKCEICEPDGCNTINSGSIISKAIITIVFSLIVHKLHN